MSAGEDPQSNYGVPGGREDDGTKTYVCRVELTDFTYCGKYSAKSGGCVVGYTQKVPRYVAEDFEILMLPPWADYKYSWSSKRKWNKISNPIRCGRHYYVGRTTEREDGTYPGSVDSLIDRISAVDSNNEYFRTRYYSALQHSARLIKGYRMWDVEYDLDNILVETISPKTLAAEDSTTNFLDDPVESTLILSYETETSFSWSNTVTYALEVGLALGIRGGRVIQIGPEFRVTGKMNYDQSTSGSKTETKRIEKRVIVDVPPHSTVVVYIWTAQQRFLVPYTATMVVEYADCTEGAAHQVEGFYDDTHYFEVETEVSPPTSEA